MQIFRDIVSDAKPQPCARHPHGGFVAKTYMEALEALSSYRTRTLSAEQLFKTKEVCWDEAGDVFPMASQLSQELIMNQADASSLHPPRPRGTCPGRKH